jgi:hypothetical protein
MAEVGRRRKRPRPPERRKFSTHCCPSPPIQSRAGCRADGTGRALQPFDLGRACGPPTNLDSAAFRSREVDLGWRRRNECSLCRRAHHPVPEPRAGGDGTGQRPKEDNVKGEDRAPSAGHMPDTAGRLAGHTWRGGLWSADGAAATPRRGDGHRGLQRRTHPESVFALVSAPAGMTERPAAAPGERPVHWTGTARAVQRTRSSTDRASDYGSEG